jgi:hypothetical protein
MESMAAVIGKRFPKAQELNRAMLEKGAELIRETTGKMPI